MNIAPGRALLGINEATCTSSCSYMQALFDKDGVWKAIPIKSGAASFFSGAFTLAALTLAAMF